MDSVMLSDSGRVVDGLSDMMADSIDAGDLVSKFVDAGNALLIVEIAKRAEDKEEWFIRGQWATIQAIQGRIEEAIDAELNFYKEREQRED